MKKNIFCGLLLLLAYAGNTQQIASIQKQESQGFWVVESNVKTPKSSMVYFYTPEGILMYKENVNDKKLKVNRRKTVKRLNAALQEIALAWQNKKTTKENAQLVARRF